MILVFPLKIFSSCEIVRTWVGGSRKEECTRAFLSRNLFSNQIFLRGIFFSTTAQNTLTISVQPNARHRLGISVKNNNNLNQFADPVSLPIQINLITKLQITKFTPRDAFFSRAFKNIVHCWMCKRSLTKPSRYFPWILITLLSCATRMFSCLCI